MTTVPDQSAVWVPLSAIMTWRRNPNKHPAHQVAAIRRAMETAGWTDPIELAQVEGHTQYIAYSGEGRLLAAKEGLRSDPNWAPKNPPDGYRPGMIRAVINRFDTIAEMEAQGIRANELARLSEMDRDGLSAIVSDFGDDIDLTTLGLSERELADLTGDVDEVDEEDLFFSEPPLPTTPTINPTINPDPGSGVLVQPGLMPPPVVPPFMGDGSVLTQPKGPPPVVPAKIVPDTVVVTTTVPRSIVSDLKARWGCESDEDVVVRALENTYNALIGTG